MSQPSSRPLRPKSAPLPPGRRIQKCVAQVTARPKSTLSPYAMAEWQFAARQAGWTLIRILNRRGKQSLTFRRYVKWREI